MEAIRKSETGATTVEVAITIFPFMLLVLGVIQLCILCYTSFATQYSVNASIRWGITKEIFVEGETRYDSIKNRLISQLNSFYLNTKNVKINMCKGVSAKCKDKDAGTSGDFITLQGRVPVYSIIGREFYVLGKAVAKNEPF